MFAVRHYPVSQLVGLFERLKQDIRYDEDGRYSNYLWAGDKPLEVIYASIAKIVCSNVVISSWHSVIIQAYRDSNAVTPCHSDHGHPISFILSLGATRTFRIHRIGLMPPYESGCGDYNLDVINIECVDGTVVVMDDEFHRHHHHQIVPNLDKDYNNQERISLVFRGG